VGLAIGGKKWGVIAGSMGHMSTWAGNLARALGMASTGILNYKEIAEANFKELDALVKKGETRLAAQTMGKIGPQTKGWEIYQPPSTGGGGAGGGIDTGAADAAKKEHERLMKELATAQKEFEGTLPKIQGTWEIMQGQLSFGSDQIKADAEKTKQAFSDMYSDLRFQSEDYHDYRKSQLEQRAEDYKKYTGNEVLAHQWLVEQIKALDEERLEAAKKNNVWLVELSERTADAIEDNFSSFYKDVFRGELDSAADYFRAFCHSLSDSFSDMLGQMTKELLFGGGSSGGSGLLKSMFSGIGSWFGGGTSLDANAGLGADWAGTLWAKGGAFEKGRVVPFAHGTIIDRPTLFPMAEGAGLMGEAGPEAILPLSRTSSGDLGVKTILPPSVQPVNNMQNVNNTTISVPVNIDNISDRRLSARLQGEIERKVKDILREEMR